MKKLLTTLLLTFLPARVFAQSLGAVSSALGNAATTTNAGDLPRATFTAVAAFLNDFVFFYLVRGAIALTILYMLFGAFQYFTAYGDENKASSAKKTITWAFIGLLVSFLAMTIAALVQQSFLNSIILNNQAVPIQ
jgi:hypothetical protein